MRKRNYYLVDHSSILLAVYDGTHRSETGMTVRYAQKLGREIIVIDPIIRNVSCQIPPDDACPVSARSSAVPIPFNSPVAVGENGQLFPGYHSNFPAPDRGHMPGVHRAAAVDRAEAGWYVASDTVNISGRVTVNGDVHLILADGCNLIVNGGIQVQDDDSDRTNGSTNALTIYAQSTGEGVGKLTATGGQGQAGIGGNESGAGGSITINGGIITATGGYKGAGIGGGNKGDSGNIIINGGKVTATIVQYGAGIGVRTTTSPSMVVQ